MTTKIWIRPLIFLTALTLGCSVGSKLGVADADDSIGQQAPASAGSKEDKAFTERLEPSSEECSTVSSASITLSGVVRTKELSASQCSVIADGIRYVCQDNKDNAKAVASKIGAITTVQCHYATPDQKTATVKLKGSTLSVAVNMDMADPSEKVRCQLARKLGVEYRGDLGDECLKRSYK